MRYYALSVDLLREHGLGDEPWRQRKGEMALTHEGEATERMGYAGAAEFEAATGAKAMTLREATEWIRG
ncbi:MAG: hypothetical protein HDR09_21210 [Lachnospiraceae bacterium]|nr:hypothetical protein [Lachnospiraceae bacterium]